uniref:(California timema) hypothetical protein n=1 Tax=Timema californicum TaxID=61474 RepID=A0A7R9J7M2_TIMCA|nr:unnamed protein product [Timema californicum]
MGSPVKHRTKVTPERRDDVLLASLISRTWEGCINILGDNLNGFIHLSSFLPMQLAREYGMATNLAPPFENRVQATDSHLKVKCRPSEQAKGDTCQLEIEPHQPSSLPQLANEIVPAFAPGECHVFCVSQNSTVPAVTMGKHFPLNADKTNMFSWPVLKKNTGIFEQQGYSCLS